MSQDRNNHDNKNLFSGRITISDVVRTSSSLTAEVPGIFFNVSSRITIDLSLWMSDSKGK